jgi:hypothetical protein
MPSRQDFSTSIKLGDVLHTQPGMNKRIEVKQKSKESSKPSESEKITQVLLSWAY